MNRSPKSEVPSAALKTRSQLSLASLKKSTAPSLDGQPVGEPLSVAALFAGVGGIELGLSHCQHETRLICEIDPAANAVLDQHFDAAKRHRDIRTLNSLPSSVDLLTGGFPCQDLSQAGRTAGITGEKSGLVGEVFRLLDRKRVEWVLLENVPFMLQLGRGAAIDVVLKELEKRRYKWAYRVVNSQAFGVPQRRERVYFLASRHSDPRDVLYVDNVGEAFDLRSFRDVACGFYWTEGLRGLGWAVNAVPTLKGGSTIGIPSPPAIVFPDGRVALPDIRDAERMQGFAADWTLAAESVAKRGARWKLVGNAVTVQAAEWLGGRLRRPGQYDPSGDMALGESDRWPSAAYNVGDGRFAADLSKWPVHRSCLPLSSFLKYELTDLSEKATAGFLSRAKQAKLRFPAGFLDAVQEHLSNVRAQTFARAI